MSREYGKDFSQDIKLDRFALDEESEMSSSMLHTWGERHAQAKADVDEVENKLKLTMAQADLAYRAHPPGDIKVTESVIASLVESDPNVIALKEKLAQAKKEVYTLFAAVDALHDKSARLHDLVDLWMKGYYANTDK